MTHWLQDLRIGWRSLWRTPGFTLLVVVVMALGIGANTMVFNIANAFLFRRVPYIDTERNVMLWNADPRHQESEVELSFPDFLDYRARAKSFTGLTGHYETQAYTTLGAEPERFDATAVTSGLFDVFGAKPILGRDFRPEEVQKGPAYTVVIISERIWRERFGSDRNVLNRTLRMNGRVRAIVGVAPPGFLFPEKADFFIPMPYDAATDKREGRFMAVSGMLKPGVTLQAAQAEVATIAADLARRYPDADKGMGARVVPYRERILSEMGPILALLMSAVGFVLLIACANVANLLLARGAGRQREIALRFALGATRARVVRQLLTESLIVAMLGGALGLILALWGRDFILATIPEQLPFWMIFSMDPNTVLFMVGVSALSAVVAGLMPALHTSQVDVHEALKDGGHQGTAGRARSRLRNALIVAEIALSVVLLTGAGLMIRSFLNMTSARSLVDPRGVLTARLTMPVAVYKDDASREAFMDALMPMVQSLPGVRSASATTVVPLARNSWNTNVLLEGETGGPDAPRRMISFALVRPDYFKTMGIALTAGHDFTPQDRLGAPRVAIVSVNAAKKLWPGQDPLGRRFRFSATDTAGPYSVIGVAADVPQSIESKRPPAQIYVAHAQDPNQSVTLLVKHDRDAAAMTATLRHLVQSRDPDMPLFDVRTMDESIRYGLWQQRIYATLMGVFAALALSIAAVGIYGVMAYSVAQRTQEIGIRMALGAARNDVLRLVVGHAFRLTAIGMGIGLAGAYAVTRLMASLLFGVSASDPPTFIGVTVILAFSALIAAWIPADRATRVDPMVALRSE